MQLVTPSALAVGFEKHQRLQDRDLAAALAIDPQPVAVAEVIAETVETLAAHGRAGTQQEQIRKMGWAG